MISISWCAWRILALFDDGWVLLVIRYMLDDNTNDTNCEGKTSHPLSVPCSP